MSSAAAMVMPARQLESKLGGPHSVAPQGWNGSDGNDTVDSKDSDDNDSSINGNDCSEIWSAGVGRWIAWILSSLAWKPAASTQVDCDISGKGPHEP